MSADLAAFLRLAAAEPFRFGEWDCAMLLANWVRFATGADPAATLRDRYRTRLGWLRIVNRAGGLVPLVDRLASDAGLTRVSRAGDVHLGQTQPGDIGLISGPEGPTGAIRVARGWVQKRPRGIATGAAVVLAAWRIT